MPLRRNRLVAWVAACAMLLQALWPVLSHARPKDSTLLVPLCTIDGVTHFLEIKTGKMPAEEPGATHGKHCNLCVFSGDRVAAIIAPDAVVFLSGISQASPLVGSAPHSRSAFRSRAHPRAPPAQI